MSFQFFLAYRSLCPSSWTARWDDQRGMFYVCYDGRLGKLMVSIRKWDVSYSIGLRERVHCWDIWRTRQQLV